MKLESIVKELNLKVLSAGTSMDTDVVDGYSCDLLSWVMANGKKDGLWITVQTHTNIVAVASLLELAAIIIPINIPIDPKTLQKANEEEVVILSSEMNTFELSGVLYQLGIGTRH